MVAFGVGRNPGGHSYALLEVQRLDAEEFGGLTELFFDAEQLVVLADAVGAAG